MKTTIMSIKYKVLYSVMALFLSGYLMSCSQKENHTEATAEEHEHEHSEGGNEVEISKQRFHAIKIQVGPLENKNLTNFLKITGVLKVPPQNKASITSPLGGSIQKIMVQEGDYVKSGQTLAALMNPAFVKLQEEFLDTKSQLSFAEPEYNRQKELSAGNVSSEKVLQQAKANYNSLLAKNNSLKQQLMMYGVNADALLQDSISNTLYIKSLIAGNVSHILVNIGSNLEPNMSLMNVVDNSQLHLDLFVFEQDLQKVKAGQTVDFSLTNLPGKNYTAEIFAVGNAFENETKTIPVHANIPGEKSGLIEGMNVTAAINLEKAVSLSIPSTAITSFGGNDYIFIQVEGHKETKHEHNDSESKVEKEELGDVFVFKKIHVKKGVTNGNFTEITALEELPTSAKVVINGAFYLMAMLTNEGEHEH